MSRHHGLIISGSPARGVGGFKSLGPSRVRYRTGLMRRFFFARRRFEFSFDYPEIQTREFARAKVECKQGLRWGAALICAADRGPMRPLFSGAQSTSASGKNAAKFGVGGGGHDRRV